MDDGWNLEYMKCFKTSFLMFCRLHSRDSYKVIPTYSLGLEGVHD